MAKYERLKHTILKTIITLFTSMLLLILMLLQNFNDNSTNIVKANERGFEYQWNNAVYGNGASDSKSKIIGDANNGNVVIDKDGMKSVSLEIGNLRCKKK